MNITVLLLLITNLFTLSEQAGMRRQLSFPEPDCGVEENGFQTCKNDSHYYECVNGLDVIERPVALGTKCCRDYERDGRIFQVHLDTPCTLTPEPTVSPTPSPSALPSSSPSDSCPCRDCVHASSVFADPHYRVWNNEFYDFQGVCDQIAIDNPILQLQIRSSRPGGRWWSGISQVGLRMKQTGETFHIRLNGMGNAIVSNTISMASGVAYTSANQFRHKFSFTAATDSFILLSCNGSQQHCTIQVKGEGDIFCNSEGMFGSWNYGGVRFRDGTRFSTAGGWAGTRVRSLPLAQSWMVPISDSLMVPPSTVCADNGPAVRRLQEPKADAVAYPGCNKTCDDIEIPFLKESCEIDIEMTEDPTWPCEESRLDPIFIESDKCDFRSLDDETCSTNNDICHRMGGYCKTDCKATDDHVCLPGLCSESSNKLDGMAVNAFTSENGLCMCFAPVACETLP